MKSREIRQLWSGFREEKAPNTRKHAWAKPASLIVNASDDPTTMFNTAGMQQFVPYLVGKPHHLGKRLYNIQWCVRTNDIEEVGDVSHLTFFEMMWNRSLGDYFKTEAITWSWEFLTSTEYLDLDPKNIAVSVFAWDADAPRDEESAEIWKWVGVDPSRIAYLGKEDNRWWPAGKTWPCGPDTEIFYWIGEGEAPKVFDPEKDEEHWLEIRNNVFMAYYKDEKWQFSELENKNVDTWMWFERICMVVQWAKMKTEGKIEKLSDLSVYNIDIFQDILGAIAAKMHHEYPQIIRTDLDVELARSYRIVADHLSTAIFLIHEWLTPTNEWRGYVLRRILRRAYYHLMKLHPEGEDWFASKTIDSLLKKVFQALVSHYEELEHNKKQTIQVIYEEMKQFQSTLDKWSKKFEEMLSEQEGKKFSGADAFVLYDTYGVPVELTQELVEQHDMLVDMQWFQEAMQVARETSRAGGKQKFAKWTDWAVFIEGLAPTVFVWYDTLETDGIHILKDELVGDQRVVVLDRTPFYAESGGQKGDTGTLVCDDWTVLDITDVQKYGGVWLHMVG